MEGFIHRHNHCHCSHLEAGACGCSLFMNWNHPTFRLIVLTVHVVTYRGWGRLGPLAVGLIVPLLMWLEGSVSSMCINPARAFGPALVTGVWDNHWIFWIAPFLGGVPAGLIYSKLFTAECALLTPSTPSPVHSSLILHRLADSLYVAVLLREGMFNRFGILGGCELG